MKAIAKFPQFDLIIDPTESFPDVHPQNIIETLGVLPHWLNDGIDDGADPWNALLTPYQFHTGFMDIDNCTFDMHGVFEFPGDPALPPLATAKFEDFTVHFYQHAFVAVIEKDGSTKMTRMD